ncbi:hypothetical protein B0H15DRAFT_867426 [Mycena belliarum]|uniref:F-box domain-containing protein n=1 Tax=Mycena belliarum TaxID=1033014 RepID=A0AAD6TP18_9AGAR|nr:hypothetical protein B0H15DRAFT_867426 [Mycena belliae]
MSDILAVDRARIAEEECKVPIELEAVIAAVQAEIHEHKAIIAASQRRLDDYKYPVLTLPNEIVSEIFIHFLPVYPLRPPLYGPLSPDFLTRICHKWRRIALGTPALWRALSLHIAGNTSDAAFELHIGIAKEWLSRSGCCPISIDMQDDDHSVRRTTQLLDVIALHQARWEYVKLVMATSDLHIVGGSKPLLCCLSLNTYDRNQGAVSPSRPIEAPLLRTVTIGSYSLHTADLLPLSQLTSLRLDGITLEESWPVLALTFSLVHCELVLWGADADVPSDLSLPHLESLILWDGQWVWGVNGAMERSLEPWVLPALRMLQVSGSCLGTDPDATLASFVTKSGCKLEEVRIMGKRLYTQKHYRDLFPSISKFSFNSRLDGESDRDTDPNIDSGSEDGSL